MVASRRVASLEQRSFDAEFVLITVVVDCYLAGASTMRMGKLVKTLGIDSLNKSQVSRMAADLDKIVEDFRHRPLGEAGPFTFVSADALTMKVREGGRAGTREAFPSSMSHQNSRSAIMDGIYNREVDQESRLQGPCAKYVSRESGRDIN